ncbi:Alkaline proteinase inhibitor precursor [compost metagenome]
MDDLPESQALQDKPSNVCIIELQLKQTLGEGADCLSAWLAGEKAIGWFTEPDGIAITGKEGSKILFFSRQRDGSYKAHLKSTLVITLVRQAH